jgi:NAD(P)-dependent dehydrogenase (short-subunit alcohol dehydrogenase family)
MSLGLRVWGSGSIGITHGVWTAARFAAEGLAAGLRAQLRPHGVPVISLHPDAFYAQRYAHCWKEILVLATFFHPHTKH